MDQVLLTIYHPAQVLSIEISQVLDEFSVCEQC